MGIERCEYCGGQKREFGFSFLAELDMKRKPNWMKQEYALAQALGHDKEFGKYAYTQIEKVCYFCEFDNDLPGD